jgi:hypothetical protein
MAPPVSGYQENPQYYMHKRIIALYTTMNYRGNKVKISCKRLNKNFGGVNIESARSYRRLFLEQEHENGDR